MKTTNKTDAAGSSPTVLPADLTALFANARQLDAAAVRELEAAARALDHDPAFVADYLKGIAVEDILQALEETGISKNELAGRLGKTRQYVSNVLNENARVNFTIDTLAQFSVALGRQLCIRILPKTQQMHVFRTLPVTVEPSPQFETQPIADTFTTGNFVNIPSSSFQMKEEYELSRIPA